jgi:cell wall-associated NlpC family hydrolase
MTSRARLLKVFVKMARRVKYRLGAKAPSLSCDTSEVKHIDCSGFVRYAIAKAGGPIIPDGSQAQLEWARRHLGRMEKYSDVEYAINDPSRLFIGFLSPAAGKEWPRHVFLVSEGQTMESCSSGGVCTRAWNTKALKGCKGCFEVPTE